MTSPEKRSHSGIKNLREKLCIINFLSVCVSSFMNWRKRNEEKEATVGVIKGNLYHFVTTVLNNVFIFLHFHEIYDIIHSRISGENPAISFS